MHALVSFASPDSFSTPPSCKELDTRTDKILLRIPKEVGARIGRSCMFIHIPCESANIEEMMRNRGFKGARPSIWVFQVI